MIAGGFTAAAQPTRSPFRLAYIVSHPIQYQAPLLRRLAKEPGLRVKTFFLTDAGATPFHDTGFNRTIAWDVPLLDGYHHTFLARELPLPLRFDQPRVPWRRLFLEEGFDGVWLNGYAHGALLRAFAAAKSRGMKVLVRGESHDGLRTREPLWRAAAQRVLFRSVDAFLAIGSANREFYLRRGAAAERVYLAPYSVDNDYFRQRIDAVRREDGRARLLHELQLQPSHTTVLFASKLQARKRCADLVAAFAALRPGTAAQLLIVGDGDERNRLEVLVRAHGLPNVRFAGFRNQSELPALYDLCDVFVLPSEREPWGLVINEAMNAARPIVASDAVGAARDLVRHGRSGFVYPVGDVRGLAGCLQALLDDRELRLRMGAYACELVGGWGIEATVDGVRAAIGSLAAPGNAAAPRERAPYATRRTVKERPTVEGAP